MLNGRSHLQSEVEGWTQEQASQASQEWWIVDTPKLDNDLEWFLTNRYISKFEL